MLGVPRSSPTFPATTTTLHRTLPIAYSGHNTNTTGVNCIMWEKYCDVTITVEGSNAVS